MDIQRAMQVDAVNKPPVLRDLQGLEVLYRAEQSGLIRLARSLIGSSPQADEVVHDAFLKLYEKRAAVDHPGGYVRQIVVNNCYSVLRRRAVERRALNVLRFDAKQQVETPTRTAETLSALDKLTPKQRTAIVLRFYEDLSVDATAELMGVKPGTVKSLVHRGLEAVREQMKDEE